MRVADYIANFLFDNGIGTVYMVAGGGMAFLSDGLLCKKEITVICNHHEQASAMAAVAHSKFGGIGCSYVSTGCGGTNALTGLLHAWQDSTPCIFISGQSKRKQTIYHSKLRLRQFGVQEADIIKLVTSITKYAVMVNDEYKIRFCLEKAMHLAFLGRPGPVWIDVPMDIQNAEVDPLEMKGFVPRHKKIEPPSLDILVQALKQAKRPLIIAGQGIRLSGSIKAFSDFVHKYKIPFVCTRMGLDSLPFTDNLYVGRMGNKGTRAANFSIQNADFILSLGARLSVSSTGHSYKDFAPYAKVFVVDIDEVEHKKNTIKIDGFIHYDLRNFFEDFPKISYAAPLSWQRKCLEWKEIFPVYSKEDNNNPEWIDLYYFIDSLSRCLKEDDVVVTDTGSALFVTGQGIKFFSQEQRYITSGAQVEMGFTLPGTIGVCMASGKNRVIGITGDGSLQMNIQELQTIAYHKLPIKLFVWNNQGYLTMKKTQDNFFGRRIGADNESGVSFPDLSKIAEAYNIEYIKAQKPEQLQSDIKKVLDSYGAVICEVMCDPNQEIVTVSSKILPDGTIVSPPIDDMYPFLPRDVYECNCIAKNDPAE
jgi:acetolactate synthase-1/2/3 large subunit